MGCGARLRDPLHHPPRKLEQGGSGLSSKAVRVWKDTQLWAQLRGPGGSHPARELAPEGEVHGENQISSRSSQRPTNLASSMRRLARHPGFWPLVLLLKRRVPSLSTGAGCCKKSESR